MIICNSYNIYPYRENAGLGPLALTAPRRTLTERTLYPPPRPPVDVYPY